MLEQTEKEENFSMPGEWAEHAATWLAWPNDKDFFKGRFTNIEKIYEKIIFYLHKDELVKLIVLNQEAEDRVKKILEKAGIDLSRVAFYQTTYVDVWVRDYGPTFVKNGLNLAWVKWTYNGYNNKFPELLPDDKVFVDLKDSVGFLGYDAGVPMEGGAIETNGLGTIMSTRECLIDNRHFENTAQAELVLKKYLGAKNFIWLNKGLVNDHTDGHIDEVARFVSASKILCAYEDDEKDENFKILNENYKILENSLDQNGKKFEVIKLPMPHMNYDDGTKAPVSYANFYIGNKTVLASVFNDSNDEKAISILKSYFPDKNVIGIDCRDLIYGGGALHCITQQQPK